MFFFAGKRNQLGSKAQMFFLQEDLSRFIIKHLNEYMPFSKCLYPKQLSHADVYCYCWWRGFVCCMWIVWFWIMLVMLKLHLLLLNNVLIIYICFIFGYIFFFRLWFLNIQIDSCWRTFSISIHFIDWLLHHIHINVQI